MLAEVPESGGFLRSLPSYESCNYSFVIPVKAGFQGNYTKLVLNRDVGLDPGSSPG